MAGVNNPAMMELRSPLQAQVVECPVAVRDVVRAGDVLLIVEAMKMEHELRAQAAGVVSALHCAPGDVVHVDDLLLTLVPEPMASMAKTGEPGADVPPAPAVRADLARLRQRERWLQDQARPDAVTKRHALGMRMARENIADLCDEDSFIEYGALAVAAQRSRRSEEDLIANTPADGMVTGIGSVNGRMFGPQRARTVVMAYDATVLAGTQGMRNHAKTDRLLRVAHEQRLPVVLYAEGGGGRPGDTDMPVVAGLHVATFSAFARLSGVVPVIGIVAGRCFAGNAALAGCCDVIIATQGSNLGMGGPAMVEGGGLGTYPPEAIGPADVQYANGVIDVLVADEAQATRVARHYLSFFQGAWPHWTAPDGDALRALVPENRLRVYDSLQAMAGVVDVGSLLPLRAGFGGGVHTALGRLEGRAVGLLANNPQHLGGAIDADAADKAARFLQLCDAHGLPVISLIDTPGFMVGPAIEAKAQVRHVSRLFVTAAKLRVPVLSVVLRKGYGLGAMGMAAGGLHAPVMTVAWPSAEFGAMGLEGAVRLGYRKELAAQPDDATRDALFQQLLAREYERGSAISMAAGLEVDAVIDPAQTRQWLVRGLAGTAPVVSDASRFIDTW